MSFTEAVIDAVWVMVEGHYKETYLTTPDRPTFDITMDKLRILLGAIDSVMEKK